METWEELQARYSRENDAFKEEKYHAWVDLKEQHQLKVPQAARNEFENRYKKLDAERQAIRSAELKKHPDYQKMQVQQAQTQQQNQMRGQQYGQFSEAQRRQDARDEQNNSLMPNVKIDKASERREQEQARIRAEAEKMRERHRQQERNRGR